MSDHIFCLSKRSEPGLIRLVSHNLTGGHTLPADSDIFEPGEQIEWSLKVREPAATLSAIKRSMKRFRKCRGKGVYRSCPMEVRGIAVRNATAVSAKWRFPDGTTCNNIYAGVLASAFLVTVFSAETAELGTKATLVLTAAVLTAIVIGTASLKAVQVQKISE